MEEKKWKIGRMEEKIGKDGRENREGWKVGRVEGWSQELKANSQKLKGTLF